MIYCFDIDGTICETEGSDYEHSVPRRRVIEHINGLYDDGHTIIIFTARGVTSGMQLKQFTREQLKSWGLKYHRLNTGKPHADVFVDDKAISSREYFEELGCL